MSRLGKCVNWSDCCASVAVMSHAHQMCCVIFPPANFFDPRWSVRECKPFSHIQHHSLHSTARSNIIYDVFNVSEKRSQKKCRGLLPIVTKGQIISPIAKQCANYIHRPLQPLHWWLPKKSKPNFLKTKQPFSFQGGGGILMGLFQSLNLDPRKLVWWCHFLDMTHDFFPLVNRDDNDCAGSVNCWFQG